MDAALYEEAETVLEKAISLKPDLAAAHRHLGLVNYKQGHTREAINSYKRALNLNPLDAEVHNNLGVAFNDLLLFQQAASSYAEAIRLRPDYSEARYNLGLALLALNKKEGALEQHAALKTLDAPKAKALLDAIYSGRVIYAGGK